MINSHKVTKHACTSSCFRMWVALLSFSTVNRYAIHFLFLNISNRETNFCFRSVDIVVENLVRCQLHSLRKLVMHACITGLPIPTPCAVRGFGKWYLQYIPRNMHTVFALLCFVVVIHWLIFPYPSGLLHWHCGNLTIAPVPAKQPWWIWINT